MAFGKKSTGCACHAFGSSSGSRSATSCLVQLERGGMLRQVDHVAAACQSAAKIARRPGVGHQRCISSPDECDRSPLLLMR
jgi:hypothetical protein